MDTVLPSFNEFVAGWIGGIGGLIASHPFDTIKVNQQKGPDTTISNAIFRMYKTGGFRMFYKGISLPLLVSGAQNAVFFGIYSNVFRYLNEMSFMSTSENPIIFISGSIAGFVQIIFTTPVELLKVRLQIGRSKSLMETVVSIYRSTGVRGFYRGYIPTAIRDVPTGGLYIGTYKMCDDTLQKHVNSYWSNLLSGGLAGAISYSPMIPIDVVKTRLQADHVEAPKYRGVIHCMVKSFREEGMQCLWKGFVSSTVRSFVNNAFVFVIYESCMDYMVNK